MALTEKVTFLLSVNARGVAKEFDKVGRAADRSLGKAEERSERLQATFRKVGAGMVSAGALAGAALYGMAQDASSMAETVDKAAVLFGEGLDKVIKFSEDAAGSLGLAKDAALGAAADFAVYGKRAGLTGDALADFAMQAVTAAVDIASFNDVPVADTLQAIKSGLQGSAEPLARFGVDARKAALEAAALDAGIIGAGEALDASQTPLAVMAAISEQAADQMGNFAMTAGSAANQSKTAAAEFQNMRLELGEAALPVLQAAVTALSNLLGVFNRLPDPIRNVVSQTALFGSGLLLLGGTLLSVAGRVKQLRDAYASLSATTKKMTLAAGGLGAVIGVAAMAWQHYSRRAEEAKQRQEEMLDILNQTETPAEAAAAYLGELAESSDMWRQALGNLNKNELAELGRVLIGSSDLSEDLMVSMGGIGEKAVDVYREVARTSEEFQKSIGIQKELDGIQDDLAGGMDAQAVAAMALGRAMDQSTQPAAEDLGETFGRVYRPTAELRDAMGDLNRELDEFFGTIQSELERAADFEQAIDDAIEGVLEHGASLDADTQAGRDNIDARSDLIQSIEDTVDAMVEQKRPTEEIIAAVDNMIASFREQAIEAGISEEAIDDFIAGFDEIPDGVRTELELAGYDRVVQDAEDLQALLDALDGKTVTTYFTTPGLSPQPTTDSRTEAQRQEDERQESLSEAVGQGVARMAPTKGVPSKSMGGNMVGVTVELDGRTIAKSLEYVSERDGGLRIKTRAGG